MDATLIKWEAKPIKKEKLPDDLDNGSLYSEWPSEVIITSDGGFLVVGKSVNEGWPSPKNVDDILVMKFKSDGTSAWNKKYNNKNNYNVSDEWFVYICLLCRLNIAIWNIF